MMCKGKNSRGTSRKQSFSKFSTRPEIWVFFWESREGYIFFKGIGPKVNVIEKVEFELNYYNNVFLYTSHNPPRLNIIDLWWGSIESGQICVHMYVYMHIMLDVWVGVVTCMFVCTRVCVHMCRITSRKVCRYVS